jgi:hypothetical protein
MTTGAVPEPSYRSDRLLVDLARILAGHRVCGGDFPDARQPLIDNLRALQSALPAAIAEIEAAMKEA